MTRVAVFTDSAFVRNSQGQAVAVRDTFPTFISRLADADLDVTIASRCKRDDDVSGMGVIDEEAVRFVGLPYYDNTEDYMRRRPRIRRESLPVIRRIVDESDVVMLRIHHALAPMIARATIDADRPLTCYFAGPPILSTARANYPGRHPKHVAARAMAARKRQIHTRIAWQAGANFFVDPVEFRELEQPPRSRPIVPTLVRADDIVARASTRDAHEALRVVFAGRLYRHKGVFDLVAAAARVVAAGRAVELHFAGQGPDETELKTAAEQHPALRVQFHGALHRAQLYDLMRSCHVLSLPSYGEGMPKVLLEGWAAGLAVVTTPVGAVPDVINDGENGILLEPGDVSALADSLQHLYDDEAGRRRIAESGLRAIAAYSWEATMDTIATRLKAAGGG